MIAVRKNASMTSELTTEISPTTQGSFPGVLAENRLVKRAVRSKTNPILLLVVAGGFSLAAKGAVPKAAPDDIVYDLKLDLPITGVAALGWFGSSLLGNQLGSRSCRWCDQSSTFVNTLNDLDTHARSALRWSNTDAANTVSNVVAYGVAPLAMLGLDAVAANHEHKVRRTPIDALLIAEACSVSGLIDQTVKFTSRRERPFVHFLGPNEKLRTQLPSDNNTSFYSGHTSFVFALAVSTGTLASLRHYRWAPAIWITGLTLAVATGYLRIAADRHYLTDVVAGAVAGSAIGFAIPYFFHYHPTLAGSKVSLSLSPAPGALGLSAGMAW